MFSCRLQCFSTLDEDKQAAMPTSFYDLPTKGWQRFTPTAVNRKDVKTRRPRNVDSKSKAGSFDYFVMDGSNRKKVGLRRKAFMSLSVITNARVFRICKFLLMDLCLRKTKEVKMQI